MNSHLKLVVNKPMRDSKAVTVTVDILDIDVLDGQIETLSGFVQNMGGEGKNDCLALLMLLEDILEEAEAQQ